MSTVIWKKEAQVVEQIRRHPRSSSNRCLILRVKVGASYPGESLSSMRTGYKSASFEPSNVATNEQFTNFKSG